MNIENGEIQENGDTLKETTYEIPNKSLVPIDPVLISKAVILSVRPDLRFRLGSLYGIHV